MRHGAEVALGAARHLGRKAPGCHRGQRAATGIDQLLLAEADSQLAQRGEADVQHPHAALCNAPLQVRAKQDTADEDVYRVEGVALACRCNLVEERLFKQLGRSSDKPKLKPGV